MKRCLTRTCALWMVLFWGTQSFAQPTDGADDTAPNIRFSVDRPVEVERATLLNKLHWSAITLVNPDPKYKLTPLFGYPASQISNRMPSALVAAAAGDVRIAILTRQESGSRSGSVGAYEGRGVQISRAEPSGVDWNRFRDENIGDGDMIAFSRPLRDVEPDEEFVATSRLWTQNSSRLAPGEEVRASQDGVSQD